MGMSAGFSGVGAPLPDPSSEQNARSNVAPLAWRVSPPNQPTPKAAPKRPEPAVIDMRRRPK